MVAVSLVRASRSAPFGPVSVEFNDFSGLRITDQRNLVEVQPGSIQPEDLIVRGNRTA
jgi:hypothetical protein